ncbi:MAG: phosphonate C-P lyase system protein PhnG [Aliarcobacter sp.]|jgi:alpha-D-ribose 1-methylphosphonate 5-triphosphate synthase subunit PhnG|uniref:phosphonate C-P lyase system protein PhnG n=1 Tax=Arcobacter sp. TaxID=1872629 RepID=UPI003D03A2A7|nr:phosphonate C-P lyase system protein PhnG [Aliarcobacter sp.]
MKREDLNYILQKADFPALEELYNKINSELKIVVLQSPVQQTLLQPIFDPISKGEFYGGEILVTTTIVQLSKGDNTYKGWAMVQDDNEKLSLYIAVCDGCFGAGFFKEEIEALAAQTVQNIQKMQKESNKRVNATRVNFDLMAQG